MGELSPLVATEALGGCRATSVAWRRGAELRLTAIAKISLALVPNGTATRAAPAPLRPEEHDEPPGYLRGGGDLAPIIPKAEVLVVGRAPSRTAVPGTEQGRLGYWRGSAILLDKAVDLPDVASGGSGLLRGLGPVSALAAERSRWLGKHRRPNPRSSLLELPAGLDGAFFQVAPADQQLLKILGGDGLLLDGLLTGVPRMATVLPELRGYAMLRGPSSGNRKEVVFRIRPDTVLIDLDQRLCHVVLRGYSVLVGDPAAHRLIVTVRVGDEQAAQPVAEAAGAPGSAPEPTMRFDAKGWTKVAPTVPQAPAEPTMRFDAMSWGAQNPLVDKAEEGDEAPTMRLSKDAARQLLRSRGLVPGASPDRPVRVTTGSESLVDPLGATSPRHALGPDAKQRLRAPRPPRKPLANRAAPAEDDEARLAQTTPRELPVPGAKQSPLMRTAAFDAEKAALEELLAEKTLAFRRAAPRAADSSPAPPVDAGLPPTMSPPQRDEVTSIARKPAVPGSSPPPRIADRARFLGRTADVDQDELEQLRSAFATPFDQAAAQGTPAKVPPPSTPPDATEEADRAEASHSLGSTASVDSAELERLRSAFATPFDRVPVGTAAPVAPKADPARRAPSSPPDPSGDLGSTASAESSELDRLRAAFATPFEGSADAPVAESPVPAPSTPPSEPEPVLRAPAVLPTPDPSLGSTASVDSLELERLRSAFATPFEQTATEPEAAKRAPDSTPPESAPSFDIDEEPLSDRDLGQTAAVDAGMLEELRTQHATPFDPGAGGDDGPSLGAAFLRALEEI